MSDLSKPNHYHNDSLGDPYTCTGDHNHPDELPQEVVDMARTAACARCKAVVVDEPSKMGTVLLSYYVPALGMNVRTFLCGACGLVFREFLDPSILDDPMYLAVKAELQARWT
jgi:hypothetical protein